MYHRRHLRDELSGIREDDAIWSGNGDLAALCGVRTRQSRCETCEKSGSADNGCNEDHFEVFEKSRYEV